MAIKTRNKESETLNSQVMKQTDISHHNDTDPFLPRAAVGAVLRHAGRFLLVKRANAPSKGRWAIPGGKIKPGETLREAAQREVLEETGIIVRALEPVMVFDLIERDDDQGIRFHYVIVNMNVLYISGEPVPGSDALEVAWAPVDDLEKYNLSRKTLELFDRLDKNKVPEY
jgi:8-oxo-dGTP diphosphatase